MNKIACTEQFSARIIIFNADNENWNSESAKIWEFDPFYNQNIPDEKLRWFGALSDVKPVNNNTCLLMTASAGAVCIVRLEDSMPLFCEYAGGNTHSAEILPDGNIVSASSTGNFLKLFNTKKHTAEIYELEDAHGTVWDKKRKCLWTSSAYGITRWEYKKKSLKRSQTFNPAGNEPYYGHDLFPVLNEDRLFLSGRTLSVFDPQNQAFETLHSGEPFIKSVSCAENGEIIVTTPKESWWTDTLHIYRGNGVITPFRTMTNMRFYKARAMVQNQFSY